MSVLLIYIRRSTFFTILGLSKSILEFTYVTASLSLPFTIDSQVLTPHSINNVIKIMYSYCDTIVSGDRLYRYELIWSQLATNRFMSPRASVSALSHISTGYVTVRQSRQTTDLWISLSFIGIKYTIICNWAVLPYFKWRVFCATQDVCIPSPIQSHQEGVAKMTVYAYKFI
jgi:hypothetical protein